MIMKDDGFVYSMDGENFYDWDQFSMMLESEFEPGSVVTIDRGIPEDMKHIDIIGGYIKNGYFTELFNEIATDFDGDAAENYLDDVTKEKLDKFAEIVAAGMNELFEQPGYFRVSNIEEVLVEV